MNEQVGLTDEALVTEVRTRDREAYAILMSRYQTKLLRYAASLVLDSDAAADIVQESFIKAFTNLQSFDTKKKFSSWMYRIVHNEAMNAVKKYRHETALPEGYDAVSDDDLEQQLDRKEIIARVQRCLDHVPIRYAEPLALLYLEDQSYEAISDILHLPMGTVATRIRRAKGIMKAICQTM